jgi:Domain of unknown function (DUF3850)
MTLRIHDLKIWPEEYAEVKTWKDYDFRKNDRDFRPGDVLRLHEWNPDTREYTGRRLTRGVSHVKDVSKFGAPGYVILSLAP